MTISYIILVDMGEMIFIFDSASAGAVDNCATVLIHALRI